MPETCLVSGSGSELLARLADVSELLVARAGAGGGARARRSRRMRDRDGLADGGERTEARAGAGVERGLGRRAEHRRGLAAQRLRAAVGQLARRSPSLLQLHAELDAQFTRYAHDTYRYVEQRARRLRPQIADF